MCGYAQPVSGAVENFPNLKGLEDEAEELEELSKLALSPVGVYSTQVSPIPNDPTTERAEEALDLIAATTAELSVTDRGTEEPHTAAGVASAPPTPAPEPPVPASTKNNGRRTSHSWRGLKKQLSRVDLKLKNTFNAAPAKKASTFYGGEQPENDETAASGGNLPQIITETDGGGGGQEQRTDGGGGGQPSGDQSSASATATRPTELKLFDRDGKPIKPPRSSKEQQQHRKRTSLDKQGNLTAGAASRDARLLSVPNIKYVQRDPKHNRSNNQAFINLAKKLSKLIRKKKKSHTLDQTTS